MNLRAVGVMKVPVIDLRATGQNIKNLRVATGISVRDLQTVLGFTNPQAIYKWQNGDSMPSIDNLVILAAVFGVTVDEILVIEDGCPDPINMFPKGLGFAAASPVFTTKQ